MRQHGGDIRIVQDQHIRRHTEGARVAGSGRRKSAVQHRMDQVGGLGHDDGAVARQGRIGARHALATLAVAALVITGVLSLTAVTVTAMALVLLKVPSLACTVTS